MVSENAVSYRLNQRPTSSFCPSGLESPGSPPGGLGRRLYISDQFSGIDVVHFGHVPDHVVEDSLFRIRLGHVAAALARLIQSQGKDCVTSREFDHDNYLLNGDSAHDGRYAGGNR